MESNGWVFDVTQSMGSTYANNCGVESWYGWTSYTAVGSIETVLQGSGMAILNYGNCYYKGVVKVYLNGNLISVAGAHVKDKLAEIPFSNGDLLKITEESGIIKLNSFEINCPGKYQYTRTYYWFFKPYDWLKLVNFITLI